MLFGRELVERTSRNGYERWVFLHSGDAALPVIYPLRFEVANAGSKGTSDLIFTLTASKAYLASETTKVAAAIIPAVLKSEIKRAVSTTGELRQVSYSFPPLGPKAAAQVVEPLALGSSYKVRMEGESTTSDDVDFAWIGEVSYLARITITAFCTDSPAVTRTVEIMCLPASDAHAALAKLKADRVTALRSYFSGRSGWGRVRAMIGKRHRVTYRIIKFSPFEKAGKATGGGYLAGQADDGKLEMVTARYFGLVLPDK